jgi:hypothetical protein
MAYSADADIEAIFGPTSVDAWADLDGDADATKMTARKLLARNIAYAHINDLARETHYTIPLANASGSTPVTVTNWEATLAGIYLYEWSGTIEFDPRSGAPAHRLEFLRSTILRTLEEFRTGRRKIDAQ